MGRLPRLVEQSPKLRKLRREQRALSRTPLRRVPAAHHLAHSLHLAVQSAAAACVELGGALFAVGRIDFALPTPLTGERRFDPLVETEPWC